MDNVVNICWICFFFLFLIVGSYTCFNTTKNKITAFAWRIHVQLNHHICYVNFSQVKTYTFWQLVYRFYTKPISLTLHTLSLTWLTFTILAATSWPVSELKHKTTSPNAPLPSLCLIFQFDLNRLSKTIIKRSLKPTLARLA